MKKLFALLLALVMALSLVACGGGDSTPTGGDTDDGGAAVSDNGGGTVAGNDAGDSGKYLTYDDLEYTQRFCLWGDDRVDFLCDYPSGFAFDSFGQGMASDSNTAFAIVVAHGETRMRDTALEEAFLAFLNGDDGCFHTTLRQVNRATYDEVTPEIEYITLDNGREAIKFSGTQHVDDYAPSTTAPLRATSPCWTIFPSSAAISSLTKRIWSRTASRSATATAPPRKWIATHWK